MDARHLAFDDQDPGCALRRLPASVLAAFLETRLGDEQADCCNQSGTPLDWQALLPVSLQNRRMLGSLKGIIGQIDES